MHNIIHHPTRLSRIISLFAVVLIAAGVTACAPTANAPLPTLAVLPTLTSTPEPTAAVLPSSESITSQAQAVTVTIPDTPAEDQSLNSPVTANISHVDVAQQQANSPVPTAVPDAVTEATPPPLPLPSELTVLQPAAVTTTLDGQAKVRGYVSILHGDPPPNSNQPPRFVVVLTDGQGQTLAQLDTDFQTAREFDGQQIEVAGELTGQKLEIETIATAESVVGESNDPGLSAFAVQEPGLMVSGSQPWINLLCKFPDRTATFDPVYYDELFGSDYPAINHYWQQISYNTVNINGTTTNTQVFTLPQPNSYYAAGPNLNALAQDCAKAADPTVNFSNYVGINFMLNGELGCCAWGGSAYITLEGRSRLIRSTWLPPWAQISTVITHEMGHGFGLPHSTGPSSNPPTGLSIYVSSWDVMSDDNGTCSVVEQFGCVPQGTIAYHLELGGWLPANRRITVAQGKTAQVTLEQLRLPESSTNPLVVHIPIKGSSTHFYTLETRTFAGYDQNVPGQAVVIHDVDTRRTQNNTLNYGYAWVVDADGNNNVNDAGAMWTPGETFIDATNGISMTVLSADASSFTVAINNNAAPVLASPANAAAGNDNTPTLSWNEIAGLNYQLQVASNSAFSSGLNDFPGLTAPNYTFASALADGTYFWRVRASIPGMTGPWSAVRSFSIDTTPPAIPLLTAPIDAASTTTNRPAFTWKASTGANCYEIQLDTANPPVLGYESTSARFTPVGTLIAGRIYYWRVRAVDAANNTSDWSPIYSLSVLSPSRAVPAAGYSTTSITLTWSPISWATGYQVQVDDSNRFTSLEYNNDAFDAATRSITPALANGVYFWRVRAKHPDGTWGKWSAVDSFTISAD